VWLDKNGEHKGGLSLVVDETGDAESHAEATG
jgi:hypothetical protein